ncbi:MAG: alkaline phosphatase, partial [Endomicrobiia bacterium]
MKKLVKLIFIFLLFTNFIFAEVKNVVLMIADGMGLAAIDCARIFLVGKENLLEFEKADFVGIVKTYSEDSLVTDSAAAATAMSCGIKTKNRYLGIKEDKSWAENIVELAKKNGKSTGLITTVSITHATPAGFVAHTDSRDEIVVAQQYIEFKNVDLFLGGGEEYFLPRTVNGSKRLDDRDLVIEFKDAGYTIIGTKEELLNLDIYKTKKLLGLFKDLDKVYYIDRKFLGLENLPTLAEMSKVALEILSKNKNGFFLMIEGGKIDWGCHNNDIATVLWEIFEFNEAVKEVLKFLSKNKNTLIIITSDHETGGLGLSSKDYRFYPEKIRNQKISAEQIAKLLKGKTNNEIKEKFKEYTGVEDLSLEEIEKIKKGDAKEIGKIISSRIEIGWTTKTHSGSSVILYAFGKKAEVFRGVYENTEIFNKIVQVMS